MNTLVRLLEASGKTGSSIAIRAHKKHLRSAAKLQSTTTTDAGQLLQDTPPAVLPATINADGLVLKADADRDIVVEIPYFEFSAQGDLVTLFLDNTAFPVAAIGPADGPSKIIRVLPNSGANLIAEGRHTVTYLMDDGFGNEFNGVPPQPLRIDRTPPGGTTLPLIAFDEDAVEHGVTVHSLEGGFLVATVPDWFGMEDFDIIEPYYTKNPLVGAAFYIPEAYTEVQAGGAGNDIQVKIPESVLRDIGDGPLFFGIVLRDQAGNASATKLQPRPLTLILEGAPVDTDLSKPIIALFEDDRLIDEADARHPVEVQIPGFDKAEGGDTIIFYLGDAHTQPIAIDASETGNNPILTFDLDYALIVEAGGGNQQYSVDAYYELYRGTALLATSPRSNPIEVNITTPGGVDPDPQTPENENLRRPTAVGDSGTDNYISQDDILTDATVFVPWFATDDSGSDVEYFEENDVVTVQWGSVKLADTHTISATDISDRIPLQLTAIPAEMASGGAGHINVSYTVSRKQGTDLINASLSPAQSVEVISTALLPGGPGGLDVGTFTEANAQNALNRATVESGGGTPFRVMLDYTNVAEDDEIVLTLQGYYSLDGTGTQTPDTLRRLTYTVPDPTGGAAKYHDFLITTDYFAGKWDLLPIGRGSVTANYTIRNRHGIANAREQLVRVAVTDL